MKVIVSVVAIIRMGSVTVDKIGKSTSTLRRWDREGILVPGRTPGNQRYYTDDDYLKIIGGNKPYYSKKTVIYSRVSTRPQKADLVRQQEKLEMFCAANGYTVSQKLTDFGSGLNFKRKNFLKLMKSVRSNEVEQIVVTYKDRLCRFGFDFLVEFCSWYGCKIIVMDEENGSPEQELVSDLLAIVHCFSSKSYSLRRKNSKLKNILKGVDN